MSKPRILIAAVGLSALTAASAQEPTFRVWVDTVPLYVVVQGGGGKPVRGLTASDFRVLEDGVAQEIINFREVELPGATSAAASSEDEAASGPSGQAAPVTPSRRRYIVLRFDPLQSPRSLQRAQQAGKTVLEELDARSDYAAVSWRGTISEFTQDRNRLGALIDEIKPDLFGLSLNLNQAADPERGSFRNTGGIGIGDDLEDLFPQAPQLEMVDTIVRETVTLGARTPFYSLVGSLKYLQGKKICIYFGQGLDVPRTDDRDKRRYDPEYTSRLFSDAGFSVFAINPLGLTARTSGPLPATGPGRSGGSMRARSEATFRMPRASGLGDIYLRRWAENTGGFAFYNNNNLKKGVRRVFEFNQHYYLIAYRSSNADYDAQFRHVKVELPGRKGKLSYRNGYFATVPAAAELRGRTLVTAMMNPDAFHDFPLEVRFEHAGREMQLELLFPFRDIPLRKQEVLVDRNKREDRFLQEILVAALVLDERGEPIGSLQETFNLELEKEQLEAMREQNASLSRLLYLSSEKPAVIKVAAVVGQNVQLSARSVAVKQP